jgi:alkylated DNA repair dioxygenase AlkB
MRRHQLSTEHEVLSGVLPDALQLQGPAFDTLWNLRPSHHTLIRMRGKMVPIPRWQQAFGRDYCFSRVIARALPIPATLQPLLDWALGSVDPRLNGLLLNWYDGTQGHYIGRHRDEWQEQLILSAPIVTMSFGEERRLRFRPWKGQGFVDLAAPSGSVLVIPFATNVALTHEVPRSRRACGKRISITLRAFNPER